MRFAQKLILFALAVALLPLAATGFSVVRISEAALQQRITDHQRAAAAAVAAKVSQAVEEVARRLGTVMELLDAQELSADERLGLARLLFRQSSDVSLVVLLGPDGAPLTTPVRVSSASSGSPLDRHPMTTDADVTAFLAHLPQPADHAAAGTVLLSPVYFSGASGARLALAIAGDPNGRVRAVAGVELALRNDVLRVDGVETGAESMVYVVDPTGKTILHPQVPPGSDVSKVGAVQSYLAGRREGAGVVSSAQGERMVAFAPVGDLGWGVIVEQPAAVAFSAATRVRQQVLLWIGISTVLVLGGGIAFASRVLRVLARMTEGARAFGEGRLRRRIDVSTRDEIGELATTMNAMAAQLESSLKEIEAWNQTLEAKVDQRTRELQATQTQLVVQSKLAALGQLGAGVAHEVNNPLAGILGMAQLMLRGRSPQDDDFGKLKEIEGAAKRCKEITMRLLRFSERRLIGRVEVSLNDIVNEVVDMLVPGLEAGGVHVERALAVALPLITADPGQLAQVFINLVNNAKTAMPKGGVITISTQAVPEGVRTVFADTGVGIKREHLTRVFDPFFTTKRVWSDVGLGLSVAYRVVADHGGQITAESEEGHGSRFIVTLPLVPPEAPALAPATNELRKSILME